VQIKVHALGGQRLRLGIGIHSTQNLTGRARALGGAAHLKTVASTDDVDIEPAFELLQMLVERPAHVRQPLIVGGLQPYVANGVEILLGLNAQM